MMYMGCKSGMVGRLLYRIYDWLSPSDPICHGDLIFALAGRQSRKLFALELFRGSRAGRVLLSVGRFEVRRFAQLPWPTEIDLLRLAASIPPPMRHYFVSFEAGSTRVERIHRGCLGTLSEIRALAKWLEGRPQIASLLVVSSAPHLRRVRTCCRALLPSHLQMRFIATAADGKLARESWWCDARSRTIVVKEIPKCIIYDLILRVVAQQHWRGVQR